MPVDFLGLQTEVAARGFDYLNDAGAGLVRLKRLINEAVHELDSEERWDYLFTGTTGAAPLTIADLDEIETVVDAAGLYQLRNIDRPSLIASVVDLTTPGTPAYWYKTAPTTVAVYPVSTLTLTVKYYRFGPDLVAGADAPLVPDRWRQAIVEKACAKAYRDSSDYDASKDCMAEYGRLVAQMRERLLTEPEFMARTHYAIDD